MKIYRQGLHLLLSISWTDSEEKYAWLPIATLNVWSGLKPHFLSTLRHRYSMEMCTLSLYCITFTAARNFIFEVQNGDKDSIRPLKHSQITDLKTFPDSRYEKHSRMVDQLFFFARFSGSCRLGGFGGSSGSGLSSAHRRRQMRLQGSNEVSSLWQIYWSLLAGI